ncbi:hypothetical protein [Streptomyces sp. NBC_00096]|uniref:hypothetical protein n=1 Tax=Streptomyces sp. NBC_00096 TaxID=2975650 RepID=UPI003249C59F
MAHGDPGLVGVVWGATATVMGLAFATDCRGVAHWAAFRRPTVFGVRGVRWVGAVFAVVGPVVLVTSATTLAERGTGDWVHYRLSVPWPFLVFASAMALNALRALRSRRGPFRKIWDGGGRLARSALVVQGATVPALVVSLGFSSLPAVLACCLTGLLAALTALLSRRTPD